MNILILYGTVEGQTQKISEYMADILRKHGHSVLTMSITDELSEIALEKFHAVIIGGSIHMGNYSSPLTNFVKAHTNWLNDSVSAFFTVCMGIHSAETKSREEASHYGEKFLAETGWTPRLNETFAGAVKYTRYNFFIRFIMKRISRKEGASTDTTRDHEYTDWDKVTKFTEDFLSNLTS